MRERQRGTGGKQTRWTQLRGDTWEESMIIPSKCCLNYMQVSHLISSSYIPFQWMAPLITTSAKPEIQELLWPSRSPPAPQPICHKSLSVPTEDLSNRSSFPSCMTLLTATPHQNWIPWGPGCPVCSQCLEQCLAHTTCVFKSFWMNEWSCLSSWTLLNTTINDLSKLSFHSQRPLAYNSPVLLTKERSFS